MKGTVKIMTLVATAAMIVSSCTREDRFPIEYGVYETHTIFNIAVAGNTKVKTDMCTKFIPDDNISFDKENRKVFFDSEQAFGFVGIDAVTNSVLVENMPVFEHDGVRSADLFINCNTDMMNASAFYPFVSNVSHHKDGSYAISFSPNDISKGPLASNAVTMECGQEYETVNLEFHHISNSIGFKVCDITVDEQLRGYMHIRKVVLHGMATEGMFVVDGKDSHWVPNAKRPQLVIYEGDDLVRYGQENALFIARDSLTAKKCKCYRNYIVPEELKESKHFVEIFFDVDDFVYDGVRYSGAKGMSQIIPLSGVVPDEMFELGLQYTFVLGMNLCAVYRPIEFTASVDEWELMCKAHILEFDNE